MLFLIAVLALVSAAFLLQLFIRRQTRSIEGPPVGQLESTGLRPLFEPDPADLKREAEAAEAREIARREYRASAEKAARVDAALAQWRSARDKRSAMDLLQVTTESGREGDFARAASEIIEFFRASGIAGITSTGLSLLIDSHMRLLPQAERSSGALFWLKQEVARLGSENER